MRELIIGNRRIEYRGRDRYGSPEFYERGNTILGHEYEKPVDAEEIAPSLFDRIKELEERGETRTND